VTWNIFKFELKYHFRSPLFYILFVIFFLLTFGAVTTDAVQIGGSLGNVNRNAPFVIMQFLLIMSMFGVLTATAYVANAVYRDFELNTDSLFFSTPVKKWQYLTGRFAAAFTLTALVYTGVVLAIVIGSKMPWLDKEQIGPFLIRPYLFSYFVLILPNLLLFAAVFFAIAALTRSLMWTYVSVAAFYVGYVVSRVLMQRNLEHLTLKSLSDPFALTPFFLVTRYWTVFDKNTRILPIEGAFLWNRVLWTAVALAFLAVTVWRFRMQVATANGRRHRQEKNEELVEREALPLPRVQQRFDRASSWQQYLSTVRVECASVLRSLPFLIILLLGVLNTIGNAAGSSYLFGTPVYPVTHLMVAAINGGFVGFAVIIAAFYAGEVVWRERSVRLSEVFDATPAPTAAMWAGKLTALVVMLYATLAAAVLTTIGVQIVKRYYNFELGVYFKSVMLITGTEVVMFAVLMFFAQIVANNRNLGYLAALLYLISLSALGALHFEHVLYHVFDLPSLRYSDMNSFGHFLQPRLWLTLYWFLFAGVLLLAGHLLWVRGTETVWTQRGRIAQQRFGRPAAAAAVVLLLAFASTGCFIYYNTNVLNRYETGDQREKRAADTEKLYKKYERTPQPRIVAAQADVDIYPSKRWIEARGRYTLVNKTGAPLRDIHVSEAPEVLSFVCRIPGASVVSNDRVHGYTTYRLAQPLATGASLPMSFEVKIHNRGFENESRDNTIAANGTFVNNYAIFPHLGYSPFGELQEAGKRRKYGLPPVQRMPKIDDRAAAMNNELTREADWIDLDTTVSTSPDQIAVAPGYLQREWTAGGRRYFRYKTTSKILPFWSYLSARYTVRRDAWRGIPIEIYYDAKHPYNVDRMIYAVKKSLEYYTTNFSPYQHRQVRIIEFPNYSQFAQSFPNTIPWSESIGFIADLRDKDDIDYVYYVGAHEVAHQWWAHQVIGADVQGATMLTETLAQYSALMVMEKEYGRDKMRRFLKFELDRYLNGRGGELVAEMPLMLVENQPYIHYRKGSVVMYALREAIGEERVNAALRKFIRDHAFAPPPYPITRDLIADFRAQTPPDRQSLLTDLFETITLYDNKATEATWTRRADGKYLVRVSVEARKLRSTASGSEQQVPVDDWIDIGVFDETRDVEKAKLLALEKHHITAQRSTFEIVVPQKPGHAGIDPLDKLVDRNPDDNVRSVEQGK
jgi:ABC-type transport system involved in multi-copper enzyme maturation permease subunit